MEVEEKTNFVRLAKIFQICTMDADIPFNYDDGGTFTSPFCEAYYEDYAGHMLVTKR